MTAGTLYGVGLGPGAADLMTVRADRVLRDARHVAFFRKAGRPGRARRLVDGMLHAEACELALEYPVTTEIPVADPRYNACLSAFYEESCARLSAVLESGADVALLCEGDPFFYGSFMHLFTRLRDRFRVEVIPGVTGMSAAWTATGQPITWGDDVLSVIPGTLDEDALTRAMTAADAIVVMKVGRHLEKIRRALAQAGRAECAWLVTHASTDQQTVTPLAEVTAREVPYFSIVLVHGQGRRP